MSDTAHAISDTGREARFRDVPRYLVSGGRYLQGESGKTFDVRDPADGSVIASVADGSVEDGIRAVDAAATAAAGWAATAPRKRADILMRCYQLMMERKEWFAELISLENGKAMPDALGEVLYATDFNRPMQDLSTEYCWGSVWTREGLDLNRPHELHVRGALRNGVTKDEMREVFMQVAIYCGVPAGMDAFRQAMEVFKEMDAA